MPTALLYRDELRLQDYIDRAGGFTADADRDHVLVMRVAGEVVRADKVKRIEPGDIILAPPAAIVSRPDFWERFLSLVQLGIGGVAMFRLLGI